MDAAEEPNASGKHIELESYEANLVSRRVRIPDRGKLKPFHFNFADWAATLTAKSALLVYGGARKIRRRFQDIRGRLVDFGYLVRTGQSRVQEVLRKREMELTKVVRNSSEPVVVTDEEIAKCSATSSSHRALPGSVKPSTP